MISRSILFRKGSMQPFVNFSVVFYLYIALHNWICHQIFLSSILQDVCRSKKSRFILSDRSDFNVISNVSRLFCFVLLLSTYTIKAKQRRCPWCNGYRPRKWTRRHEFKSWTRLIAFHIALIPLGKVWIQLFSFQLWVNSRADKALQLWWGN